MTIPGEEVYRVEIPPVGMDNLKKVLESASSVEKRVIWQEGVIKPTQHDPEVLVMYPEKPVEFDANGVAAQ